MTCAVGEMYTITVSEEKVAYSFGYNDSGQLGLGHNENLSLPVVIPNLPQIKMVSCGWAFTVCIDFEGYMWSFGQNNWGQLGLGNTIEFNHPQKIEEIPPVQLISCGGWHTLAITNNEEFWSFGANNYGQLCLENTEKQVNQPHPTPFSNVTSISTGCYNSLFQINGEKIYGCGRNLYGELGIGNSATQIKAVCIPNQPKNIIQFCCGLEHTLFLNSEGDVFGAGNNHYGSVGVGKKQRTHKVLIQIPDIPKIETISCTGRSSFLIDFDGNVWSFGYNSHGQLGHGDTIDRAVPTEISSIKNIKYISSGSHGEHVLAKDSDNKIFIMGENSCFQLVNKGYSSKGSLPEEMKHDFTVWGVGQNRIRAKSARK